MYFSYIDISNVVKYQIILIKVTLNVRVNISRFIIVFMKILHEYDFIEVLLFSLLLLLSMSIACFKYFYFKVYFQQNDELIGFRILHFFSYLSLIKKIFKYKIILCK